MSKPDFKDSFNLDANEVFVSNVSDSKTKFNLDQIRLRGFFLHSIPPEILTISDWTWLCEAYDRLPRDNYISDSTRFRCLNRLTLDFHENGIVLKNNNITLPYTQNQAFNPILGNVQREYQSDVAFTSGNKILQYLISSHATILSKIEPEIVKYDINIHAVRYQPKKSKPSNSTPAGFHKDGEPYYGIYVLQRKNIVGGETEIADNNMNSLGKFTLQEGEGYFLLDSQVYHSVVEMNLQNESEIGYRDILNIDYLPRT